MNRFQLATWATLAGVTLAAGLREPLRLRPILATIQFVSTTRGMRVRLVWGRHPYVGGGPVVSEGGPFLGEAPGALVSQGPIGPSIGSPVGPPIGSPVGPPLGQSGGPPATLPPNLGAPFGPPSVPPPDGRLTPIPNAAQPVPAEGSSRVRGR